MADLTGWFLDVYAGEKDLTIWLLGDEGKRHCLSQPFPVTFYASTPLGTGASGRTVRQARGDAFDLRSAWRWFSAQPEPVRLARAERRDLFAGPTTVLAVEVRHPADQPGLFRRAAQAFPDLTWYDADIPLALRYSAAFGVFPLARCRVEADGSRVRAITPLDSPWDLDPVPPPLRLLTLEPDCDPSHAEPKGIFLSYNGHRYRQPFEPARALLVNLRSILERYDSDLLLTAWGDTWLLPRLLKLSEETGLPLPLNRDPSGRITRKDQRTYYAYGQVIYRGAQVHLAGRWHIDACNAVMYHDYGLEGIFELARVTGLPVQTVARTSPGTGISAMQMATALRQGVLVPWRKQQAEAPKSVLDLVRSDMGGMVYQPTVGLHADVAEVDFVSMYPSIMAHFNISPETVLPGKRDTETGLPVTRPEPGLVPQTLQPLLQKRIALKSALMGMSKWDSRRKRYQAAASAHKWLLVTCFGYLGYKNARFGRIEAHEAVTAYGREALLRAKEAAEALGFEVLHLYVDGMWVKKAGSKTPADFQPLLDEILERTGLPIALDGVYRWVAFLSSRVDVRIPVANRYFGVFQSGEIKARGIELRRRDTPAFVRETQQAMLEILAKASAAEGLPEALTAVQALFRKRLAELKSGRVPVEKLIVRQTLSRELARYRSPSPAAIAGQQLADIGKIMRPGQSMRLVFTRGKPGVRAWDLDEEVDPRTVDVAYYSTLMRRAVETMIQPFTPVISVVSPALFVEAPNLPFLGRLLEPKTVRLSVFR
ncbi:MAG TPA: DNA polymerase domain-containing protein [Anaerolineales bacterium]